MYIIKGLIYLLSEPGTFFVKYHFAFQIFIKYADKCY